MDIQANAEKKGSLICEYGKEGLFLPCNETNAMTVTFEETYLQELYEKGKTSDTLKSNKSFLEIKQIFFGAFGASEEIGCSRSPIIGRR